MSETEEKLLTVNEYAAENHVSAFENFAEQLTALFGVLEETANTSVGKKIGNLLSGKK